MNRAARRQQARAAGHGSPPLRRAAEFWQPDADGAVSCTLCYRECTIAEGAAGWCRIRRNEGGRLTIPEYGVVAGADPTEVPWPFWRHKSRALRVSATHCTAACTFCTSTYVVSDPDSLPWVLGSRDRSRVDGRTEQAWGYQRAVLSPAAAVRLARTWRCTSVWLGSNEPTLTIEYTLDVAREAKQEGLPVNLDTNGFTSPTAIAALAPHVDAVLVGVKGHGDPDFYAKHVRAEGAVPHILTALKAWRATGVHLMISDVLSPPHWTDRSAAAEQMTRLYGWIAEELGPLTPLQLSPMIRPGKSYWAKEYEVLLPHDQALIWDYQVRDRVELATTIAAAAGLRYVYNTFERRVSCHACGGVLLADMGDDEWSYHARGGRCAHCGTVVPIVTA